MNTLSVLTTTLVVVFTLLDNGQANRQLRVRTKSRVFNGQDARLGYFPHQVSMSIDGEFECGGSILNENWILTAAHCVDDLHKVPKIKILAGSITNIENYNGNEPDGQLRDVDCVKWHPNYKGEQNSLFPYDIALLRLSQPLDLKKNNNVRRIEIPNAKHVPIQKVYLSGFGGTEKSIYQSPILKYTDRLQIISDIECSRKEGVQIPESIICAGGINDANVDACAGDSGGPLTHQTKNGIYLVGLVSSGRPCMVSEANDPTGKSAGFYTYVPYFKSWIYETIVKTGSFRCTN